MLVCILFLFAACSHYTGSNETVVLNSTEISHNTQGNNSQTDTTSTKSTSNDPTNSQASTGFKNNNSQINISTSKLSTNNLTSSKESNSPTSNLTTSKPAINVSTSSNENIQSSNTTKPQNSAETSKPVLPDDPSGPDESAKIYDENGLEYVYSNGYLWLSLRGKCTQTDITVPNRVNGETVIGVASSAFTGDSTLESITFSEGITTIETCGFFSCSQLKTVKLPSTLKRVERQAFSGCPITSIELPDGLTYIGKAAFLGLQMKRLTIPNSVQIIESMAFRKSALEEIVIPKGTTLGDGVFRECSALTSVTLPEGITAIPSHAFYKCSSLTTLNLPESIVDFGSSAFYNCKKLKLKQVTLRNSSGSNAFHGIKIENVDVYANLQSSAFSEGSIEKLTIHEGVTSIGKYVFERSAIGSVTFPASLSEVKASAFNYSYINEAVFKSAVSLGHSAFKNSTIKSITLPDGSKLGSYVVASWKPSNTAARCTSGNM